MTSLFSLSPVGQAVLVFALTIGIGLAAGGIRIFGIRLGVAGVLFAGLIFGHFKIGVQPEIAEFAREFGLMLFVYTVGIEVGPAFFSSFKREGLTLNILAAFVVLGGILIAFALHKFGGFPVPAAVGIFSGATTNTPSLAAAQQALKEIPGITAELTKMPALGYALAYPFGIIGIILTMLVLRFAFRINIQKEADDYTSLHLKNAPKLQSLDLKVENPNLDNCTIQKLPIFDDVVISRIIHNNKIEVALPQSRVHLGDTVRAVGTAERLEALRLLVGSISKMELRGTEGGIIARRVLVTRKEVVSSTIDDLTPHEYKVVVTRVSRGNLEFPANEDIQLNYADILMVVGKEEDIKTFASRIGDNAKELNHPQLIPVFIGLGLGVLLGSLPIHLPGMPAPLKLGLAGGPLIIAILLSRIGKIGPLIWYLPIGGNLTLRETGITLFLACVGLRSGDRFVETLMNGPGLYWMLGGVLITAVPLLIAAFIAKLKCKLNYLTVCGLLAGSMTDPPALAYANQLISSSAQIVAYASVYPLVMLLRILVAQVFVLSLR